MPLWINEKHIWFTEMNTKEFILWTNIFLFSTLMPFNMFHLFGGTWSSDEWRIFADSFSFDVQKRNILWLCFVDACNNGIIGIATIVGKGKKRLVDRVTNIKLTNSLNQCGFTFTFDSRRNCCLVLFKEWIIFVLSFFLGQSFEHL